MSEFASHTVAGDTASLRIDVPMTIYNAGELKQTLLDSLAAAPRVRLDLSQVGDMDTAGFQLLIMAKREALRNGHEFEIVAHSPAVQEVIEFFNMAAFFGDPLVIPAGQS